ncbi:hypothetical protein [Hymenobacter canadensis]|uniref:Phage tail protein n=1 Tax=Hymenobacter canadensis TaxID=2999067 RepID=A0ABY7LT60_9BACT|nr:hypothetical protein [Hymenobacter canadensis]WBA43166.1 hypothetical protein O3303_06275 [Hymenobacter canadensis]
MASEILATNVVIKINDKVFGCAQTASFSTKREMTSVVCSATGGFTKQVPGAESWDGSLTAVMRVFGTAEEATNVTAREMYSALRQGALVDIEYQLGGVDEYVFSSKAYLSNVDFSIPEGSGVVTWTAGLIGAEPLLLGI